MSELSSHVFLASPFPDGEIVNSYLGRASQFNCIPSIALTCQRLLARKPGLDLMPSGMRQFHRMVGYLYGELDALIQDHTGSSLYCCGLPLGKHESQRERLLETIPGPVRLCRLPVLFTETEGARMECPECRDEQIREFGFPFVHRNTMAPFVCACPRHLCELRLMPKERIFDTVCRGKLTLYQLQVALEFAARVSNCLETPPLKSGYHKDLLVEKLCASGWASEAGRLHLTSLLGEFQRFFDDAFADARLKALTQTATYIEAAIRSILRRDRAIHPVWCVLFSWFAENCECTIRTKPRLKREVRELPKVENLAELCELHGSFGAVSRLLGVNASVLTYMARQDGYESSGHRRIDNWKFGEIEAALRAGQNPREAASRFEVSLSTAYRILAATEGTESARTRATRTRTEAAKTQWLLLLEANPCASSQELRKRHSAVWAQLRRNDAQWLREHVRRATDAIRRRRPSRFPSLVASLGRALISAQKHCEGGDKPPQRMSRYRLQAMTGISEYAMRHTDEIQAVGGLEESRGAFVRRRLAWARASLGPGAALNWALARTARLRVETVRTYSFHDGLEQ